MKPDFAFKSVVMEKGIDKLQSQVSKAFWANAAESKRWKSKLSYEEACEIYYDMTLNNFAEWQEAVRINNAKHKRTKRLKNRVASIISQPSLFLTLTFTDDCLSSTSSETRRRYVDRFLSSQSNDFVANIDYGKKNGREHYHAVVKASSIDYTFWHVYGAIKGEKIRLDDNSDIRLSKYISKLTNHAIKKTAGSCRFLYSRKKRDDCSPQ